MLRYFIIVMKQSKTIKKLSENQNKIKKEPHHNRSIRLLFMKRVKIRILKLQENTKDFPFGDLN